MDLIRHLRCFIVVAEELHFSRAAELLGMAQPPLSQTIRRLEKELGTELFDRSRRQVRLTGPGALLMEEARELLAREERLRAVMRRAGEGELGTLRVGVPPETSAAVLKALLTATAERTGLHVDVQEVTTAEQLRLLTTGQLDAGLVDHPVDATDLELGPAVAVELGVVLPRTSPLVRSAEVALDELAGQGLVLFPRAAAPGWYDRTLDVCRRHGFVPSRLRHARNPEFLLGLVTAGLGVAFDRGPVARREPRVVWRPLAGRPLVHHVSAAWPSEGAHPGARRFAEIAAEVLAKDTAVAVVSRGAGDGVRDGAGEREVSRPWSVVFAPWGQGGSGRS